MDEVNNGIANTLKEGNPVTGNNTDEPKGYHMK
jgi:hypothetical protein